LRAKWAGTRRLYSWVAPTTGGGGSATLTTVLAAIPFVGLIVEFLAWRPARSRSSV